MAGSGAMLLPEAIAELELAVVELRTLKRELEAVPPTKLFNVIPLTEGNLTKFAAGMGAAFFSTIVRKVLFS